MKFQKKIILSYAFFSVFTTLVAGILFYTMSVRQYKERIYSDMRIVSDVKLQQFEDLLQGMESVSTYLLSDSEVLEAIFTLSGTEMQESYADVFFNEATGVIRARLNTYYLMSRFYRVIVFNQNNIMVANNNYSNKAIRIDIRCEDLPWLMKAQDSKGKNVIIGQHKDDWGSKNTPQVISLVKEVQGVNRGYIEVQKEISVLNDMFITPESDIDYMFFTTEGELLYTTNESLDVSHYIEYLEYKEGSAREINAENGEQAISMERHSQANGIVMLTIRSVNIGQVAMREVLPLTVLMLGGFLLLSLGYVYLTSRQLTRPIKLLKKFMEDTSLDNLKADIPEKLSNDEIEALFVSYKDMLVRLHDAIIKERHMSMLQLQAQFDLLQAQVNPHFIYNILNVISNRGIIGEDEVICDICSDLAGMMRYSTNTKEKYATVRDEKQYLELYLSLQKYRYDYKLSYEIEVEEEMLGCIMPKIVLQQIVENSISHGYTDTTKVIEVSIVGWKDEKGWYIKIQDNGCGIPKEKRSAILREFGFIKRKLSKDRSNVELEIGGMGLVNTFARLYLLYNEALVFEISDTQVGTTITLGCRT